MYPGQADGTRIFRSYAWTLPATAPGALVTGTGNRSIPSGTSVPWGPSWDGAKILMLSIRKVNRSKSAGTLNPKEASKPMRSLRRFLLVPVGLLSIGLVCSSARANDDVAGRFTLHHPAQLNNTVLPAGDYTFMLTRIQGQNAEMLAVRGANQNVKIFVHSQWGCENCPRPSLNLSVQGNRYAVASMDVPGFHASFDVRPPAGAKGEELVKNPKASEQVAVQVDEK
jgi:hypothetical protein